MSRALKVLAALGVVLVALLAPAFPASAQGEEPNEGVGPTGELPPALLEELEEQAEINGAGYYDVECLELLAEGGSAEDVCYEAPNPLLPELKELIWGTVGFVVVFLFLAKFGYPAIKAGMNARTERIRDDLNAAEASKAEADQVLSDYRAQLADAKAESSRIIEASRQQADAIKTEQEQRLQAELAGMREQAMADVAAAKTAAIADLRDEVATLAIGAAEVVVQRNLDRDTQGQLVEQYIAQVAGRSN